MRSPPLVFAVAAIVTACALVHCAATNDGPGDTSEAGAAEAGATADGADPDATNATDASDAGLTDAPFDAFVARCSLDHWCRTMLPGKDVRLLAVWSFRPDDAIAVGSTGMLHWDGAVWSAVDSDAGLHDLTSLWASGPNDVWAVAQLQHRLLHGTRADGGVLSWSSTESDGGATRDIVTGAGTDLFIVGVHDDGTPALEHSVVADGGTRTSKEIPITIAASEVTGIFASSTSELWLSGRVDPHGVVLRAKKTGANYVFTQSAVGTLDFEFRGIWGDAPNDIWAIGVAADNFHRSPVPDGGGAWAAIPNYAQTALSSIWGSGPNDVYVVGFFGGIRHWDGMKWSISRIAVNGNPIFDNLTSVHGSSADDVWAVGEGIALHRTPGGGP